MAERLAGAEATAFHNLYGIIRKNKIRNTLRMNLFLAKKRLDKIGFSVPASMADFDAAIGWPEKAVMVPARRIQPRGFSTSRGSQAIVDELNETFDEAYIRQIERMWIDASLQTGVSFSFVTPGDQLAGEPEVIVSARSALEATATFNRRTQRVDSALELVDTRTSVLYLPGETLVVGLDGSELVVRERIQGIENYVPCVPARWGRSLDRPYGRSRITRPVMDLSGQAIRTMLRQEVHAEHFSSPQRALEGAREEAFLDKDGKRKDAWDIVTGSVWGIPDFFDEETGEWRRANLKQLAASSMQPHSDQLRSIAMMFSGETAIPVSQLGIIHDNPSSADAIRAHESDLVSLVEAELPNYADDRRELARAVMYVLEGRTASLDAELRRVQPIFADPGTITRSAAADRATKFVASHPEYADSDVVLEMWGFDETQLDRLKAHRLRRQGSSVIDQILSRPEPAPAASEAPSATEEAKAEAEVRRLNADTLGLLRRAGVTAESAAATVGLDGLEFIEGDPVTIKVAEPSRPAPAASTDEETEEENEDNA